MEEQGRKNKHWKEKLFCFILESGDFVALLEWSGSRALWI